MDNDKLISIIVPIYNAEKFLAKCIESILNQSYKNIEIILVNDGSTDNSQEICELFNDDRIRYFYKDNSGVSSTRNMGITASKGDYIMFVDADDYLDENCLEILLSVAKSKQLPALPIKTVSSTSNKKNFKSSSIFERDNYFKEIIDGHIGGFCWGYLYDAKIVKKIMFNEDLKYMEDTLFLLTYILESGTEKIYIAAQRNYYNYIIHPTSATNKKNNLLEKINNMFFVLEQLNIFTNKNYESAISNKKIRLLESEMRFLKKNEEYKTILKQINIEKYSYKNFRYKVFCWLYMNKSITLLKMYYFVRKIIKRKV